MPKKIFITIAVVDTIAVMFVLCMMAIIIHGCGSGIQATADPFTSNPNCTIYEDLGIHPLTSTAVIPKIVKNPCAAQNIIATTVETGIILSVYQASEFVKWANATKDFIKIGMPFEDVKECVDAKIPELNERLGIDYVTISSLLEAIPGENTVTEDDRTIMLASLDDLIKQVNNMKSANYEGVRVYLRTSRFRS